MHHHDIVKLDDLSTLTTANPHPPRLLALLSVDAGNLIDDAVLTAKIADGNVVASKLAADAVTTVKITWLANCHTLFRI